MKLDQTNTQILILLSEGLTSKEIAAKMFISRFTVRARIDKMKADSKSKNTTHLVCQFQNILKITPDSTEDKI